MNIAFKLFDMLFSLQKHFFILSTMIESCHLSYSSPLSRVSSACIYYIVSILQPKHGSIISPRYDTRFLELVRPRLAVLDRRERTGVAVVGDVSLGQPCWSKISMQPLLPVFLAIIMAVWPWLSFAFTSIPYCWGERDEK